MQCLCMEPFQYGSANKGSDNHSCHDVPMICTLYHTQGRRQIPGLLFGIAAWRLTWLIITQSMPIQAKWMVFPFQRMSMRLQR